MIPMRGNTSNVWFHLHEAQLSVPVEILCISCEVLSLCSMIFPLPRVLRFVENRASSVMWREAKDSSGTPGQLRGTVRQGKN
jgi:hypothetical protein